MIERTLAAIRSWLCRSAPSPFKRRHARIRIEQLEDRITPSAGLREQYMLELINRMRANPAAELPLLLNSGDADVNAALDYFNVDLATLQSQWNTLVPAPPLAWNDALAQAATAHSQAMLDAGVQSHQVPGEASLGTRITAAGYAGWNSLAENIYARAESVFHAHAAFAIDWGNTPTGIQDPPGHRLALMSTSYRDVGIGILDAPSGSSLGPLSITQDFGNRSNYGNPFFLGVVFNDANSNGYYDQGEGLGNVTLTITGASNYNTATTVYGGYQIALPAGNYSVVASGGGLSAPLTANVTIGSSNVRINFVNGSQPPQNGQLPFSDDFNRPDSGLLGSYWTARTGSIRIANYAAVGNVAGSLATVNGVALTNSSAQAEVTVGIVLKQYAGVVARYVNANNFYAARVLRETSGFTLQIYKKVGGIWTRLASAPVASGIGTLRFDVVRNCLKAFYGGSLVAFAFDSSLSTAGGSGIWAAANARLDNSLVNPVDIPATQSLPFTDAFAASAPTQQLNVNWWERSGNFSVANGAASAVAPGNSIAILNGVAFVNAVVQADVTIGPGQSAGLIARFQANGNFYLAHLAANAAGTSFTATICKRVGGVFTKLNATSATVPSGAGTMRFEVFGNSLKLFFGANGSNLSLIAYAFNSSLSGAGHVGMRVRAGARLDNFAADSITVIPVSAPYFDTFTQNDGSQLSRNWTERTGNFSALANALLATNSGASLATLNGASLANALLQINVHVQANQGAALIGRYQSNGSYYLAQVKANSTGTNFSMQLFKFKGGVFTLLKSAPIASGTGTLRFVLSGSSLQVYYGADPLSLSSVLSTTDSSISAAGQVGIRATNNAMLDSFMVNS